MEPIKQPPETEETTSTNTEDTIEEPEHKETVISTVEDKDNDEPGGIRGALSTIAILVIAPLIALLLTAFVFQSYEVDGPSMETTLQNHDRLIVYKLPKTFARITGGHFIPKRYDIIIFNRLEGFEYGGGQTRQLIKRVIALPGERVVVKDGKITVYNSKNPNGFSPDEGKPYSKSFTTTPGDIDLVVPENQLYVCGDNRLNSLDSRSFGPINSSDIVGKLAVRVYPFGKSQAF